MQSFLAKLTKVMLIFQLCNLLLVQALGNESSFTPQAPECIAPASIGGGLDLTCRNNTDILTELNITPEFQVANLPGAGGGVAFATVVSTRSSDDNLLVAASTGTTMRLAQKQFADFSYEDVRWVAATTYDFGLLAVAESSSLLTLESLVTKLKEDPSAITFGGGSAVGGQDHMKIMLLAQYLDIDPLAINYLPFEGGGEAITALLSGFIDVFPGDTSESLSYHNNKDIRVLSVLSDERLTDAYADTPTAKELGYDISWTIFRGFWAPKDMSDSAYSYWVESLRSMSQTPIWQEKALNSGLQPVFIGGDDFTALIAEQIKLFEQLTIDIGLD